jgi:hypothetical protein
MGRPRDTAAIALVVAGLVGAVFVVGEVVPPMVGALPGTGAAYAVAVLVLAHLPGLALAVAFWRRPRRKPSWWDPVAALVIAWYVVLLIPTFDLRSGSMGALEEQVGWDRYDAASAAIRAACVGAALAACVLGAARRRRAWLLATPVVVIGPFIVLARDALAA